jgi:hypothetical protein
MNSPCKIQDKIAGSCATVGRAFESVWMPLSVQQITMKMPECQSNTVRTLGQ